MSATNPSFPIVPLLCSLFLLMTGCTKSNNSLPTNGTMSAMAGGKTFNAAQVGGVYSQGLGFMAFLGYTIQSADTTGFQIQFTYLPPVGANFSSDSTGTSLTYFVPGKRYDAFTGNGKVVVFLSLADTVNHKIQGSFNGTVYNDNNAADSVIVTNGKFTSTYSVQP